MAEVLRLIRLALVCSVVATGGAAARQLGDFGRVAPGVVNDTILPGIEWGGRILTNQPVSTFNLTDEEREMHNRVWRFLVAPQARNWAFEYGGEIQPAKAGKPMKRPDRYYKWLSGERYASSHARYNSLADHAGADSDALPQTFRSICVVIEIDRQRAVAAESLDSIEPQMLHELHDREAENDAYIDRFVLALGYRYDSYSYALDRLLVETPHKEAVEADARLSDLATWVDRANAGDFCGDDWRGGSDGEDGAIRSRVLLDAPSEGEFHK